ncbi:lysostaphin resistance A-like protein [Myroides sp. LJL119]
MKYIEQLLRKKHKVKLWLYLPFSLFFFGIMIINAIALKSSQVSTNDIIKANIALFGKNGNFLITVAPLALLLLLLWLWVVLVQKQSIRSLTTGRQKIDYKRILFGFVVWSVVCIGLFGISYWSAPQDFQWNFELKPFLSFFVMAIILIPMQTSFEEYFMRGYLMQGIGLATTSRGVALILTSLIFGLMHLANPEVDQNGYGIMVYYIGTGVFLGVITLLDQGLELALGFHAANNLVGVLLVTSNWTAFQTNSLFLQINDQQTIGTWEYVLQIVIILPIVGFIFSKKYKWGNYRELLFGRVK